jgi:hypothetical protein
VECRLQPCAPIRSRFLCRSGSIPPLPPFPPAQPASDESLEEVEAQIRKRILPEVRSKKLRELTRKLGERYGARVDFGPLEKLQPESRPIPGEEADETPP